RKTPKSKQSLRAMVCIILFRVAKRSRGCRSVSIPAPARAAFRFRIVVGVSITKGSLRSVFRRQCASFAYGAYLLAIAHRGASGHAPESTLAAFRRAVSQGVSFIETDLHLTRDAHFVAIHDDTVDRTTGGHGAVNQLTLAEIRRLDAGSWFASEFIGERIP